MKAAIVLLLMFAGVSAGAEPRYTVVNKCPPAFKVTNKMPTTSGVVVQPRFTDTGPGITAQRPVAPVFNTVSPVLMQTVPTRTFAPFAARRGSIVNCGST